jgi:hypothetical protein
MQRDGLFQATKAALLTSARGTISLVAHRGRGLPQQCLLVRSELTEGWSTRTLRNIERSWRI